MGRLQEENQQLGDHKLLLEAEVSMLTDQAETLTGENEALKTEARLQDEQLQQLLAPSADYGQLSDRLNELESENAQLKATTTTPPIWSMEQLQELRDRILRNWRVAGGGEKKERIKEAIDRFIEALPSIPASTPTPEQPK